MSFQVEGIRSGHYDGQRRPPRVFGVLSMHQLIFNVSNCSSSPRAHSHFCLHSYRNAIWMQYLCLCLAASSETNRRSNVYLSNARSCSIQLIPNASTCIRQADVARAPFAVSHVLSNRPLWFPAKFLLTFPITLPHADKTAIAKHKETVCHYDGKEYHDGQKFYPENVEATCICAKGFNNATVVGNKDCEMVDCNIRIHYSDYLHQGCAPVYYGKATGCPIEWICRKHTNIFISNTKLNTDLIFHLTTASENDVLMASDSAEKPKPKTDLTSSACTFGKLDFDVGDQLKTAKSCVKCGCSVPPMIHCIQDGHC